MENDIFGGFTAVAQSISDKITPIEADKEDKELPGPGDIIDPDTSIVDDEENGDHIPLKPTEDDDFEDGKPPREGPIKDDDIDEFGEIGEAEGDVAAYLQEKLFDKFGFEMGDETFKSVDDVVDFVKNVVEENSAPKYADEELAKMDEFVRNGGSLEGYLNIVHGGVDIEHVDIKEPATQKTVISEHLKSKGYSDSKITRAIERYEDAGTLEEEAEDAKDMLKEFKEETANKLLEEQEIQKEKVVEEQQKYVSSVKDEIEALSDVRGIPVTGKEKKELFDYIFKPTKTGRTRYQEDYTKTQKNLIESAYFTMKGDKLIKKVQQKATSDAASRLRKKLASKGSRGRNQSGQGGNQVLDIWETASSQLRSTF